MSDTERLFIGVPVDEQTQARLMHQLPKNIPGRLSPPENWHFTLKFLGSTDANRRDALIAGLSSMRFGSPFDLSFERLGAFPNSGRARVLWIGTGAGHERLETVAKKVEAVARSAGFEAEKRPFKAHLTISRMREPESVALFLSRTRPVQATMRIEEVLLYRSELGASHSRYTVVAGFPL